MSFNPADIRAIAFDFDGVIADTQPLHEQAWLEILAQHELPVALDTSVLLGVSVADFVRSLPVPEKARGPLAAAKRAVLLRLARERSPPLYDGAAEAIMRISRRFPLVLVSSCERELVEATLDAYGLADRFAERVLEGDYAHPKPHPEPYQIALRRLGLAPGQALAVEDSVLGVESARAAGLRVVAVTTTTPVSDLECAHRIVPDLRALLDFL